MARLHRLVRLLTLLQSGYGRTVSDLEDELNISRRTLFRDLHELRQAGVPVYYHHGHGYRIRDFYFLPPSRLSVGEIVGLMTLARLAEGQHGQPLIRQARSAIDKLLATVPEPIRSTCHEITANVHVQSRAGPRVDPDHFTALLVCMAEGRLCRLRFAMPDSPDQTATIECLPLKVHFIDGHWFLLMRQSGSTDLERLHLAAIRQLDVLDVKIIESARAGVSSGVNVVDLPRCPRITATDPAECRGEDP